MVLVGGGATGVVGVVVVASRGFNKLPPPGMKSVCCTGDLLTIVGLGLAAEDDDVVLVVVDVEGTTTVVDRLTSIFKGCSTVDLVPPAAPEGFSSVAAAAAALAAAIILFFLLIDSTTSFIDILPD